MTRKRILRQTVSAAEMGIGVVIILGYSPSVAYSINEWYIIFGWAMVLCGLFAYTYWRSRLYSLLVIPITINAVFLINYALDHAGTGLTTLVYAIACVAMVVLESQYVKNTEKDV